MTTPRKESGRVGSTKSRTGCDTCKIRRVRCGEERPFCLRCTSTGRRCFYRAQHTASVPNLPQLDNYGQSSHPERRAFEYYFHQAGPALSGILDLGFWSGSVLQICRLEPAVWDAVIALSALYERPPVHEARPFSLLKSPAAVRHSYHHDALVWYSRSLAALRQRIESGTADVTVSMIGCILFIAIELLQGNRNAAMTLYQQGAQMMTSDMATGGRTTSSLLLSTIKSLFQRLGTWVFVIRGVREDSWFPGLDDMTEQFTSLGEARNVLCSLVAEFKALNTDFKDHWHGGIDDRLRDSPALILRQEHLLKQLQIWYELFTSLQPIQQSTGEVDGATATLLMTYLSILVETRACLNPSQITFDQYEAEFIQILGYAPAAIASTCNPDGRQPSFTFEMGIYLPLFITALKCRAPLLRRQALRFLLQAPAVQGLYMCIPTSRLVAILIALEEDSTISLDDVASLEDLLGRPGRVPTARERIDGFMVSSQEDEHGEPQPWLNYTLRDVNIDGSVWISQRSLRLPALANTQ
ncbi:transcriptional regulator family: Fungal Specific TF [Penicillium riverlandense]|uniref:transcriptional regulator family: Fungal Specific TF n=1 Tax=Penicillium riverlandense TaxID=1903569 RepID=UPI002547AB29|nr:transcriptional regulator family: Fungal Specific TF [Penicillium riverlandense]KAJ5819229.1 transcriptional regulator family: Fungal Specific TF [Penicillium riverlandense]